MDFLTIFEAFTYGLSSSLTLCLASCLPFYMPILFGYGDDQRKGFNLSIGFAIGRFAGYFLLGMLAAAMGRAFLDFFSSTLPALSTWMVFAFGVLTVFYGTLVLAKTELKIFGKKHCSAYIDRTKGLDHPMAATAFLGFVSTISPCVPVFTFLLLPFALGKVWETAIVTVAFGLGANMAFIVIGVAVGFGMKNVKERFIRVKRPLEIASAVCLIVFGSFYAIWAVGPMVFGWANQSSLLPSVYDFRDFILYILGLG